MNVKAGSPFPNDSPAAVSGSRCSLAMPKLVPDEMTQPNRLEKPMLGVAQHDNERHEDDGKATLPMRTI